jgi:hypothetical protein
MARKSPNAETLKILYVRSGNECAFPNCEHPVFNDKGLYIAQLCHISAANKGGQRYNEKQTDEERSAPENLLFMCHRHHKETDNEADYPVDKLTELKINHEFEFTEKGKEASKEMIRQVLFEISYFWKQQSLKIFKIEDLKIERDFNKEVLDLCEELNEHIETIKNYCDLCAASDSSESLSSDLKTLIEKAGFNISIFDKIPYAENPFENRNWEMHNIGRPNFFSHISLCLNQLKVKTVEELLKGNPGNKKLKNILEESRKKFDSEYDNSYYVD